MQVILSQERSFLNPAHSVKSKKSVKFDFGHFHRLAPDTEFLLKHRRKVVRQGVLQRYPLILHAFLQFRRAEGRLNSFGQGGNDRCGRFPGRRDAKHSVCFKAMKPHPERVFRNVQMSWTNQDINAHSAWTQLWRNARTWTK